MTLRNSVDRWGSIARSFHWIVFVLFSAELIIAEYMEHPPFGLTVKVMFMVHKSVGVTLLGLVAARIAWRFLDRHPAALPGPAWQQSAKRLTHLGLYGVMIMVPLSGYVMSVAGGKVWQFWGLIDVPNLVGIDPALKKLARKAHFFFVDVTYYLLALHVAAVVYHVMTHGPDILRRMMPSRILPPDA